MRGAATAVPVSPSVIAPDCESDAMRSDAVLLPPLVGEKVTAIVQVACGLRSAGQSLVCVNSVALAPRNAKPLTPSATVDVLRNTTLRAALDAPAACSPKAKAAGASSPDGAITLSFTVRASDPPVPEQIRVKFRSPWASASVVTEPEVGRAPLQSPLAAHSVVPLLLQVRVDRPPALTLVGVAANDSMTGVHWPPRPPGRGMSA